MPGPLAFLQALRDAVVDGCLVVTDVFEEGPERGEIALRTTIMFEGDVTVSIDERVFERPAPARRIAEHNKHVREVVTRHHAGVRRFLRRLSLAGPVIGALLYCAVLVVRSVRDAPTRFVRDVVETLVASLYAELISLLIWSLAGAALTTTLRFLIRAAIAKAQGRKLIDTIPGPPLRAP